MMTKPQEPFGAAVVREMHESRLAAARSQYEAGINRLWAGCGGGLIGVVSVLRHPQNYRHSPGLFYGHGVSPRGSKMANPDHLKMLQQGVEAWNAGGSPFPLQISAARTSAARSGTSAA